MTKIMIMKKQSKGDAKNKETKQHVLCPYSDEALHRIKEKQKKKKNSMRRIKCKIEVEIFDGGSQNIIIEETYRFAVSSSRSALTSILASSSSSS